MADGKPLTVKAGEVLFLQGEFPKGLFFLQSGTLEILSAEAEYEGLDQEIILSKSRRVGFIDGKILIAGFSDLCSTPYKKSLRALTNANFIVYPLGDGGFAGFSKNDPGKAISVLKHFFNRFNSSQLLLGKTTKLLQNLLMINDNIALIYKELSQSNASDDLHDDAKELSDSFFSSGGKMPSTITAKFLITDNSSVLNKKYISDEFQSKNLVDEKIFSITKKMLSLEPKILAAIIRSDESILAEIYKSMTDDYQKVLDSIDLLLENVEHVLHDLYGDDSSWTEYLIDNSGFLEWLDSGRVDVSFLKNFLSFTVKLNSLYESIIGEKISNQYAGVKKIHQYYNQQLAKTTTKSQVVSSMQETTGESSISQVSSDTNMSVYNKSLRQIMDFAVVEQDFQVKFYKLLNDFKSMKNPFNTESDGRKIRRHLSKMYWDLFKKVYLRKINSSSVPKPVDLMLKFGFLDEELIEESQLKELVQLARLKETSDLPIYQEFDFLRLINSGEEEPSITEMGLNYKAHLRDLEKHSSRKKVANPEESLDENVKRTLYEIDQRLASTAAVCSGATSTAFPILTSAAVKGNLTPIYSSKKKLEGVIKELQGIDFSIFYRETVLKLGEAREIIQEEILPYIIVLPIFGTKTLLWQELSGTNKRSRGRIVVPIFFIGDLRKSLAHTLATFRWELNRSIKGPGWADPIDGGLTGEYFDYVNTYKKNSKLSVEAKEKLKERFKALRNDRDRFADDYLMWVLFEKDGIMKLNSVTREMFYKHVPFSKAIRERLANMPAFSHAANRYKNISNRNYLGYERRFKKYMDENGNYPEEIANFFKFMKL